MPPLPPREEVIETLLTMLPAFALALAATAHMLISIGRKASFTAGGYAFIGALALANFFNDSFPIYEFESFPAKEPWHHLFSIALVLTFFGTLLAYEGFPGKAAWPVRILLVAGATWLLTPVGLRNEVQWLVPGIGFKLKWLAPVFGIAVFLEWTILEAVSRRQPGASVPWAVALSCVGAAAVILHSHSLKFMYIANFAMAALVGIGIVGLFCKVNLGGFASGVAVILPGLMSADLTLTDSKVPLESFILAATSPIAMGLMLFPPLSRIQSRNWRVVLIFLFTLIPVVIAVVRAMQFETIAQEY